MHWRVELIADLPNLVLAHGALDAALSERNAVIESTGGVQRRIVITVSGEDEADARRRALELVNEALRSHLKGELRVESATPEEQLDEP